MTSMSHHTCTSFTHTHISSTLPCTHREVLFSPVWHFQAVSLSVFPWTAYTTLTVCCLPFDPACRLISLCLPPAPTFALPLLLILPCLRYTYYCLWTLSVWPPLILLKLHLDLTTLPLHYKTCDWMICAGLFHATYFHKAKVRPFGIAIN